MSARAITKRLNIKLKVFACFAACFLALAMATHGQVFVANSVDGITVSDTSSDGSGVLFTTPSFDMNGGNAVALYVTAEGIGNNSAFPAATFAGQEMTALTAQDPGAGAQTATIFYLVDPVTSVGAFEVTMGTNVTSIQLAYSQISLANVGSVADTDTGGSTSNNNGTPIDLTYVTTTNAGFVLGSAVNNDWNGARPISMAYGNPDTQLLEFLDVGSSGHFHTYGNVPTAGTQTDGYLGQYQRTAIATVAFETANESLFDPLSWAAGSGTWDITTTANWSDSVALVTYDELAGTGPDVTFDDTAGGGASLTVTLNTTVGPLSVTVSNSAKDYTLSGSGNIVGGMLTKEGSGTLTLSTVNTYSGGTFLNDGTVVFSALDSLGTGGITFNGGTLQYSGNTDDLSTRSVTFDAGGATIDVGAGSVIYVNAVGGSGPGGFTKQGSGILELQANNLYAGDTVVDEGTLVIATSTEAGVPNSPVITVNSGAILDGEFFDFSLNGGNGQKLAGTGTMFVDSAFWANRFILPAGSFVSPATNGVIGTLTLNGDTTLEGATLQMDVSNGGNDAIAVVNGTLTISSGVFEINVVGADLLDGAYTLLTGTFSGDIADLTLTGFSQEGQVALLSDATPGQIDLIVAPLSTDSLVWAGNNPNWEAGAGTSTSWSNGPVLEVFNQGDFVSFTDGGATEPAVSVNVLVFPGSVSVDATADYSFEVGGGFIGGSAALTKSGSGTLTINTPNINDGGTTINAGTVAVGAGGLLGAGNVTNNGALVLGQTTDETIGSMEGTGSVVRDGIGTVTLTGGSTHTGPTTITSGILQLGNGGAIGALATASIHNEGTLGLNTSTDINLSGTPVTGVGNLIKGGSGALTLGGSATFADLSINADGGLVTLGAANQVQGTLTVQSNSTLNLNGFDLNLTGIASDFFAGGTVTNSSAGSTNTITVTDTTGSDASFDLAESAGGGVIALVKKGAGEMNWRGITRTYSGGTTIEEGSIRLSNGTGPFGTGPVYLAGGGLYFNANGAAGYGNATYLLSPVGATTNTIQPAANDWWGAPCIGTGDLLIDFSRGGNNDTLSINGGAAKWAMVTNTVYLRGDSGWFRMNSGSDARNVTFDLSDSSTHINATSGGDIHLGALVGNTTTAEVADSDVRTVYVGNKSLNTSFAGRIGGNFRWVKVGTGNQTFSGTNTCSGFLTVSNGTLALSGAAAPVDMNPITVASPGILDVTGIGGLALNDNKTFAGDGTVVGDVSVTGTNVSIAPGFSPGVLSITGNLTLTSDATLTMELDNSSSPTSDQIAATGTITGGGATVNVANIGPLLSVGQTFTLFNQAVTGATVNIATSDATGSYVFTNKVAIDGTIEVLAVTPNVDPTPTEITYSVSGGDLMLGWPESHTGWTLQAQTNDLSVGLSTNWVDLGYESTNSATFPVDETIPTVFYRLTLP